MPSSTRTESPPSPLSPAATTAGPAPNAHASPQRMAPFLRELIRPYRGRLVIVFVAMVVETAMSLAAPWPIKVVIDNVVSGHRLPEALSWVHDFALSQGKM